MYEINPRKKRAGLFKGEIWVDPETGLSLREAGRLVKNPSVFLKKVEFTREFAILDGVAMPTQVRTTIQTRFWGPAHLVIRYQDYEWKEKPDIAGANGGATRIPPPAQLANH